MALNAQGLLTIESCMVIEIRALAGMAAGTGHHLACPGIENVLADRMIKKAVFAMAFAAYLVDWGFSHGWMIGAVRCMTVITGVGHLMLEFCSVIPFKGCCVTLAAYMTFFSLEQPVIVAGMRRMAGHTTIIFIAYEVIV